MRPKERYIVRPDEVIVTRQDDSAVIEYKEKGISTTHLKIGSEMAEMSDEEIVELHNECLRSQAKLAAEYKHVAIELPLGSPQIKYHKDLNQWVPRGGVVRCQILDDESGELVVEIDDQELNLEEFGKLLKTYCGWGMRIEFVPDDAIHRRPTHAVREPEPE